MKDRSRLFGLGVMILILVVGLGILLKISLDERERVALLDKSQGLPVLELSLEGTSFEEISGGEKTVKYPGNELTVIDGKQVDTYSEVEVKGRGNSTWMMPKKPLQLKLEDKVDLLGLGKARKWVLLANYLDASQLRNSVAADVAEMLGIGQALRGRYVELSIDGEYQGLYYLTHKVEISKKVVDLRNSLGVLVELDNLHRGDENCYWSTGSACLLAKDMVSEDLEAMVMEDFLTDFNQLEVAAENRDYAAVESLIDVESFAAYFLLNEFTANPDAYCSSWFMYKDGFDDKIHAGPGWDFDYALGNREWVWRLTEDFFSPENDMIREIDALGGKFMINGEVIEKEPDGVTSKLIYHLMKMPEFQNEVRRVYQEKMAGRKNELLMHLKWQEGQIYAALTRDYNKWERGDFAEEIDYLTDWVERRYDHFEKTYGDNSGGNDVMVVEV